MAKKLIDADELNVVLDTMKCPDSEFATDDYFDGFSDGIFAAMSKVLETPAADVVSKSAYDQVLWERDLAVSQLEELGLSLGEKSDGKVQTIAHGCWKLKPKDDGFHYCSICLSDAITKEDAWGYPYEETLSDYCPWCGTKMDGKE